MKTKDITQIAVLTSILFVQEQLLSFLPNIQLTMLIIILYSRLLSLPKVVIIVTIHVLLDNLYMGGNLILTGFMLIAWLLLPILLKTLFKRQNEVKFLSIFAFIYSFIYSLILIPATMIISNLPFLAVLATDLLFQILLAVSSFLTVLYLFEPLYKRLQPIIGENK